jgi:hypothetical protein
MEPGRAAFSQKLKLSFSTQDARCKRKIIPSAQKIARNVFFIRKGPLFLNENFF